MKDIIETLVILLKILNILQLILPIIRLNAKC